MCKAIRDWILRNQIKKIAMADPYFAIKGRPLGRREAEALLKGKAIPDGEDIIRKVREELAMKELDPKK